MAEWNGDQVRGTELRDKFVRLLWSVWLSDACSCRVIFSYRLLHSLDILELHLPLFSRALAPRTGRQSLALELLPWES